MVNTFTVLSFVPKLKNLGFLYPEILSCLYSINTLTVSHHIILFSFYVA